MPGNQKQYIRMRYPDIRDNGTVRNLHENLRGNCGIRASVNYRLLKTYLIYTQFGAGIQGKAAVTNYFI